MQRPNAGQHGETDKQNWKRPGLELRRKFKLRELIQVERATDDVNHDDPEKHERAAEERIESQLHRSVFLVGRTEDRDQEIFRDDDQLIKKKKEKEISAEKNAVGAGDHEQKPEEKLFRAFFEVPGKQNCADGDDPGHQNENQTDSVEREMIIHPERRKPRHTHDRLEVRKIDIVTKKCGEADRESGESCGERNPFGKSARQK